MIGGVCLLFFFFLAFESNLLLDFRFYFKLFVDLLFKFLVKWFINAFFYS